VDNLQLIDSVFRFVKINKLEHYTTSLYLTKAEIFRMYEMYDSMMIYTLKAQALTEKEGNIEDRVNVLHLLGDMYYQIRFYERAKQYFLMIDSLQGDKNIWNGWRKFVIKNNLALIEMQNKNYTESLKLFSKSLNEIPRSEMQRIDSVRLAYIKLQQGKLYLYLNDYNLAYAQLEVANNIFTSLNDSTNVIAAKLLLTQMHIKLNQFDASNNELQELSILFNQNQIPDELKIDYYTQKAHFFESIGQIDSAYFYLKSYNLLSDKIESKLESQRVQQIFVENEFESLQTRISGAKQDYEYLLIFVFFLIVLLLLIIYQFRRNKQYNRLLVKKNLEFSSELNRLKGKVYIDSKSSCPNLPIDIVKHLQRGMKEKSQQV